MSRAGKGSWSFAPPGQPEGRRQDGASPAEDFTVIRPLANHSRELNHQAGAAARAGLTLAGDHYLPGYNAVKEREEGALASSTRAGLAAVDDRAREVMQALKRLQAAERRRAAAQRRLDELEAAHHQLADDERELRQAEFTAAEAELAEARQALEQLEPSASTASEVATEQANHDEAEAGGGVSPNPSSPSPRTRWVVLEAVVAFLLACGGFGATYLGWRATLLPRIFLIPSTVATVAFLVWLALIGGRHLKDLVHGERARWRYDRLVMLLIVASGVMAWAAIAHMRESGFRAIYQAALGQGFAPDYSYVPWLFWLGLAEFGGMLGTSYFCAWKLAATERPPSLIAQLKSSAAAHHERRMQKKAESVREEAVAAARHRVAQAKITITTARGAGVMSSKAAIESAAAEFAAAQTAVDECREHVAGLVPGLLRSEEDALIARHAQAASGNATCCDYHQLLLQHGARLKRGIPQRAHDWWHGIEPTAPEGKGQLPAIEEAPPRTAEQVHRIASSAKRALIDEGFLHPRDFLPTEMAAAVATQDPDVSSNGYRPQLPAITSRPGGSS